MGGGTRPLVALNCVAEQPTGMPSRRHRITALLTVYALVLLLYELHSVLYSVGHFLPQSYVESEATFWG